MKKDKPRTLIETKPAAFTKSAATRERILLKAAELFRELGYDATSLRMIATHVEMQAASIYYHFETKEDILSAVIVRGMEELNNAVTSALAQLPPDASCREKVETAISTHLACLGMGGEYTATFMSVYMYLPPTVRHSKNVAREQYFDLWYDLLEEGIERNEFTTKLDPSLIRRSILVAMTRSLEWEEINETSVKELATFFSQMLFHGIT